MKTKIICLIDELKTELKKVHWKKVIILGVLMGVILGTFGHCASLNAYAAESDTITLKAGTYRFNDLVDVATLVDIITNSDGSYTYPSLYFLCSTQIKYEEEDTDCIYSYLFNTFLPNPVSEEDSLIYGKIGVFVNGVVEGTTCDNYYVSDYGDTYAYIDGLWSEDYYKTVTLPTSITVNGETLELGDQEVSYEIGNWFIASTNYNEVNGGISLPSFSFELAAYDLTSNTQLAIRGETETKTYDGTYFNEDVITLDYSSFTPDYIGGGEYRYRVGISNMPIDSRVLVYSGYPLTSANLVKSYSILSVASSGVSVNDGYVVYIERGTSSTLTNPEFNITFFPDPDYKAAYDEGFDDGYDYGYSAGQVAGREEAQTGYDAGYAQGHSDGYNLAASESFGENLLGDLFNAPLNALNSWVLYEAPNGVTVTMGGAFGAMIALTILLAFLKMFSGG